MIKDNKTICMFGRRKNFSNVINAFKFEKIIFVSICLTSISVFADGLDNAGLEKRMNEIWNYSVSKFYSSKTGLFYTRSLESLPGVKSYITEEQYKKGKYQIKSYNKGDEKKSGYNLHGGGTGTEDCSLFGGILLAAICDKYSVIKDPQCRHQALMVYKGLYTTATVHGQPGFIARGVCHEDGKSIFAGTSRDQYTNAIYGLWRYYNSPLSSQKEKTEIKSIFSEVADKMIRDITPENHYSFIFAYGVPDDRGVAKMNSYYTMRLTMIYAAAWNVTGKQKYYDYFRKYIDNGIVGIYKWIKDVTKKPWIAPAYVITQQNQAIDLVLHVTQEQKLKEKILVLFKAESAYIDSFHIFSLEKNSFRNLAEIIIGQLKVPEYQLKTQWQEKLRTDITKLGSKGWPTANYTLFGAYWGARARGYFSPKKGR